MATRKKGEQNSFILYYDSMSLIEKLTDADAGQLLKAIFRYKVREEVSRALSPAADMAFTAIQNYLDRDAESYRDKCSKNAENGRKGGLVTQERARQQGEANQANASNGEANQADSDSESDSGIDNDIASNIDNDLRGDMYEGCGTSRIAWTLFQQTAKSVFAEHESELSYSFDECMRVFKYYFDKYKECRGETHPIMSKKSILEIMHKMPRVIVNKNDVDVEPDDYEVMIDRHFETSYKNCDYNINHFFSGEIRSNRYYETLY